MRGAVSVRVSLDNGPGEDLDISGQRDDRAEALEVAFYSKSSLSGKGPHTVNITVTSLDQLANGGAGYFSVAGIIYTPIFQSLEQGDKLYASWLTENPQPDTTTSGTPTFPSESPGPQPSSIPPTNGSEPAKNNVGLIVGGVFGGLVLLALTALLLWFRRRRGYKVLGMSLSVLSTRIKHADLTLHLQPRLLRITLESIGHPMHT